MPMSDDEIRRTAAQWREQYGDEAVPRIREIVATIQATGDYAGADEWLRVIVAVQDQRREEGR
jgi:hypothetical protein